MTTVFSAAYASAYDLIYGDKDYVAECALIRQLFQRYASSPVLTVLDLGSGTGSHAFELARNGYDVVGVERSDGMLALAEEKLRKQPHNGRVRFEGGDIRSVNLEQQFDSALIMFAVLSYQLENDDVLSALRTARRHLRADGLLILDVWHGPAVLHQRPSDKEKTMPTNQGRIVRRASGTLDVARHSCEVRYHLRWIEGEDVFSEVHETHRMRYFFPLELSLFLSCSGFSLIRLGAFPDFEKDPDETTWNVLAVARAL